MSLGPQRVPATLGNSSIQACMVEGKRPGGTGRESHVHLKSRNVLHFLCYACAGTLQPSGAP
jgi:hypothetical protein